MASRMVRPYVCTRCASTLLYSNCTYPTIDSRRSHATRSGDLSSTNTNETQDATKGAVPPASAPEPGAMTRRLQEATEETLFTGGRAGRRAIEDAGFSDELKERLLAKVKDAQFRSEHAAAFAEADMPASAGRGTRIAATSQPWTGQETPEDAALRMLTDAHKPLERGLRGRPKISDLQPVDTRIRLSPKLNPGHKVANARDKASVYASLGMKESEGTLSDKEKAARREEYRERFQPGARALPNTLAGLSSLANERIEDAIARGQFKHIPRGKGVERDARSDNPFIDTTEYIMNKMIKRQDLVPPWIEKQQELTKAANTFRARLRNDWKRHAARMIASKGGSLEDKIERARQFAKAEKLYNPRKGDVDGMAIPTNSTNDVVMVKIRQPVNTAQPSTEESPEAEGSVGGSESAATPLQLFRDQEWLKSEQSYMESSINNMNTLARSYNLMAPDLAKKPYFSLQRELDNCYADVAPLLADTIKERASQPSNAFVGAAEGQPSSILDRLGNDGAKAKIYDSKAPHYGLKEMMRDLLGRHRQDN
ncbi:hypothetical protein SAMD00023353_1600960 [Rosellinia necatrix]|uniref:DnaJ homologue subfamily C member 28 conserved domain-containing protein n=1 Tax=Rosellinia necatrix TaxID=77044 RepID=A0A1W2TIB3_ROSNE|nr:hypothetical protein SAMD00023353_1600960 [Rosellinia necatrix]